MIANGWELFYFRLFKAALDELEQTVATLAKKNPSEYKTHPKTSQQPGRRKSPAALKRWTRGVLSPSRMSKCVLSCAR